MNGNYGQGGYIPRSMMMSRMGGIPMMGMAAPPIHMQHQQMAMAHAYHNMAAAAYAQHPDMQGRHVALEEEWEAERERPRRGDRDRDRSRDRDRDRDRRPDRRDERNDRVDRDRDRESRRRDDRDSRREQRDRDRGRDRESSRSSRDRSRSRDKDRGERDRDERYDREERYDRDERYDVDDRYEREGREGQERYDREGHRRSLEKDDGVSSRWMSATPSNTLLLRNLALNLTESDISAEFKSAGIPIREVRLMKHKVTGASRGFAFVEFATTTDAQHWMETNQGAMTIQGIHYVPMVYSAPRLSDAGRMVDPSGRTDWICSKCNAHNFKRRDFCFKCDVPREESERTVAAVMEDGSEHVGINPCNTLLLRGLDALTTEETITNQLSEITGMPVKNVKVIRDDLTNTSKGYAFVELHSLADSQEVLGGVTKRSAPLEIDGKAIIVTYAKNTFSTTLATLRSAASQSSRSQAPPPPRISPKEAKTTNSAAAVAQAAIISAQQQKYHQSEHGSHHHHHKSSKYSSSRKATAAALNAQEQAQWSTQNDYSQSYTQSYQYPPPDVSTYQYDETSGYYYDSSTGLYYDPNTQYYWNQETQQFMYWEPSTYTYQVAPNQAEITQNTAQSSQQQLPPPSQTQNQQGEEAVTTKKEKEKKEKVKMAKKIAKDMEKWAKSMNKTKNKSGPSTLAQPQPVLSEPIYTEPSSLRPSTADAGYAMLSGLSKNNTLMPPPSAVSPEHGSGSGGGLVASYGGDSDEEEVEETLDLDKLIDLTKMACLLCKRQFPNKDVLSKHIQLSDLHKKNVDELVARQSNPTYRDRAKERRKKVGSTPPMGRSR